MSDFNVWSYLAKMGVSVRGPGVDSMAEGDKVAGINTPNILTFSDIEEFLHVDYARFNCQVPGCKETFSQLQESEKHYSAVHRHSCSVCKKSLPSSHLLEIHIQENHDSFFAVLSERKPSYQCFLPTCSYLSWNASERHEHAIKAHKFPPDFRFDKIKKSTKAKKKEKVAADKSEAVARRPLSLARMGEKQKGPSKEDLSSKRSSICIDSPSSAAGSLVKSSWNGTTPDISKVPESKASSAGISPATKKSKIPVRSNSCRVPRNLSFGAGIAKTFIRPKQKHWHQTGSDDLMDTHTNIEHTDFSPMRNALPNQ